MANPILLGMPLELLVHIIATYLPTKDLGALRLTCKHFDRALFDTFAKEFFTKKQFMISSYSLGTLLKISEHPVLSSYLNHVIIGLENYGTQRHLNEDDKMMAYREGCADQFNLRSSGRARDMLAQAFRNLPNLNTLGIRDYDAMGRVRDGTRWRSYGAPTIRREVGFWMLTGSETPVEYASEIYGVLLRGLSDARKDLPSIEVILRHADHSQSGVSDSALYVSPQDTRLQAVLKGLQSLLLTVELTFRTGPNYSVRYDSNEVPNMRPFLITHLSYTENLKHLRVNFARSWDYYGSKWFIRSLATTPDILPNLERLEVGKMAVEPQQLVDVIFRFSATLKHASFWDLRLLFQDGNRWQDPEDRYNPWPSVLTTFSKMPKLESLMVGRINHFHLNNHDICIRLEGGGMSRIGTCKGDMKVEIPKLIASFYIDWPPPPTIVPEDEEDSEDEDEDEEEDEDMEDE